MKCLKVRFIFYKNSNIFLGKIKVYITQLLIISFLFAIQVSSLAQEKIILTTEDYPPFNMTENGKITGIATDILREAFKRANIEYSLEMYPWVTAFQMTLKQKDTGVFSAVKTPEREMQFKWVGPIAEDNWVLIALKGSKIKINQFEDAKNYLIGVYNGDALYQHFMKSGFTIGKNIILTPKDRLNAVKLKEGHIDMWATESKLGFWLAKVEKVDNLKVLYVIKKTELYIAFNLNTDQNIINKLNFSIKEMKDDGTVDKINKLYLK
ncbi:substrate-binding periplasmic protein [Fluviispira multicolorata]|uniref:Transporter substrate-binding domain-containing protein n=1 Tax=Fluviispira multicolorata TaxID=2654512 RepID=A0A833N5V9_9BACT|nr:ABC transporter substrate-binding protein [Fluviispira multicolorata]KAB8031779.1 transporter substrate-binding domain-containing protein [Fluviispira multicolorata]